MTVRYWAKSDIGRVRKKNEDSFLVDEALGLYAVADGMGGHQAGEVASALALETVRAAIAAADTNDAESSLALAIEEANRRVFAESLARGHAQGMGTTLTLLWLVDAERAIVGHVGDSRIYRLRGSDWVQLSHDHSWVQVQIDEGHLSPAEAHRHPLRNVITRSIGFEPTITGDVLALERRPGDRYLLASDGLTGKLSSNELRTALAAAGEGGTDGRVTVDELVAAANARGGEDNITVIVLIDDGPA